MDEIVCRGEASFKCTSQFLPDCNVHNFPDVAINLLPVQGERANELLCVNKLTKENYVAIGPSFVMKGYLGERYIELISQCIDRLTKILHLPIVLIPHSRRHSPAVGVDSESDDLDVCNEIAQRVLEERNIQCMVIDKEYSAHELKAIIGNAYVALGSRFHFLVAALSSGVPSIALGWSHKYHELFSEFGMERYVRDYRDFNVVDILAMVEELATNQMRIKEEILAALQDVKERSEKNIDLIVRILDNRGDN